MDNGHACPCDITATLGTPHRTLMRWRRQLGERGAGSFYQPRAVRGATVLTAERLDACSRRLDVRGGADRGGRAERGDRANRPCARPWPGAVKTTAQPREAPEASRAGTPATKSQRSREDAAAAAGLGDGVHAGGRTNRVRPRPWPVPP
ncbi:MAG: hypothetical protein U1F77_11885 [Kiritimatiellia bacterium]